MCKINNYSIPYLQFNLLAINGNHTSTKLDSYCQVMDWLKSLIRKLKKKTGFSNSYIKIMSWYLLCLHHNSWLQTLSESSLHSIAQDSFMLVHLMFYSSVCKYLYGYKTFIGLRSHNWILHLPLDIKISIHKARAVYWCYYLIKREIKTTLLCILINTQYTKCV